MEKYKKELGKDIYELLNIKGAPWSVGTTAIIAGLGLRLINIALAASNKELYHDEVKAFFSYCDEDDQIFNDYMHHKEKQLNLVPLKIVEDILNLLEEIIPSSLDIKENVQIDYQMGIDYLLCGAKQASKIIKANQLEGTNAEEYSLLIKRIEEIELQAEARIT